MKQCRSRNLRQKQSGGCLKDDHSSNDGVLPYRNEVNEMAMPEKDLLLTMRRDFCESAIEKFEMMKNYAQKIIEARNGGDENILDDFQVFIA